MTNSVLILHDNWYQVFPVVQNIHRVHENGHCDFYFVLNNNHALFIDTGIGLNDAAFENLLQHFKIESFQVLCTHTHCDHIGMHSRANEIFINSVEWNDFKNGVHIDRRYYYSNLSNILKWPSDFNFQNWVKDKLWNPTAFIANGSSISQCGIDLECIFTPGHTSGHVCYINRKQKIIFLGDMIYDGALYLHLKNSNFEQYHKSLSRLIDIMNSESFDEWLLLPSHNSIPLRPDYLLLVYNYISKILKSEVQPRAKSFGDSVFDEAVLFQTDNVKIYVSTCQLNKIYDIKLFSELPVFDVM